MGRPDFPGLRPTCFHGDVQNPASVSFPVAPSVVADPSRHGNVCPSCIGCACRPRLSSRLTLGGLASPRKPWVFGGMVSRHSLATHACILTSGRSTAARAFGFAPPGKLPYQSMNDSAASAPCLSPAHCRRAPTRPVSCYALFECMAASKPTSWLSGRAHILCHLARPLGPWRAVWAVSLSSAQLSPRALTPGHQTAAFGVWSGSVGGEAPSPVQCSTSAVLFPGASPKAVSGRTRYLRV